MLNTRKLVAAGALWTAASLIGAAYLLLPPPAGHGLGVWGIMVALVAQCVTQSLLLDIHRTRVQQHIAVMEAERYRRTDLHSIH